MPRFKLTIEYAGTRYSGWQIQKNARTVQGEIDRAVRTVTGRKDFELYGSGRTDAGVHALGQVAHLDVSTSLPPETLRQRLNDELPADINILDGAHVPHRFHARHDAVARAYLYQIARRRTAFAKAYVWWVREPLDVGLMRERRAGVRRDARFQIVRAARTTSRQTTSRRSTLVLVERLEIVEDGELVLSGSKDRTSSGRWCGASSACWSRSAADACPAGDAADVSDDVVGAPGAADRAAVRAVSRPRLLRRRFPAR